MKNLLKGLARFGTDLALLRGDISSRGTWYRTMRESGVLSVNDILALEDLPPVPGGDERYASLNYVPLKDWAELSRKRADAEANEKAGEKSPARSTNIVPQSSGTFPSMLQ